MWINVRFHGIAIKGPGRSAREPDESLQQSSRNTRGLAEDDLQSRGRPVPSAQGRGPQGKYSRRYAQYTHYIYILFFYICVNKYWTSFWSPIRSR